MNKLMPLSSNSPTMPARFLPTHKPIKYQKRVFLNKLKIFVNLP